MVRGSLVSSYCTTEDYKEMYGDFSDAEKSYDLEFRNKILKFEINELCVSVVVSCVELKPFLPVFEYLRSWWEVNHHRQLDHKSWKERLQIDTGDNN